MGVYDYVGFFYGLNYSTAGLQTAFKKRITQKFKCANVHHEMQEKKEFSPNLNWP